MTKPVLIGLDFGTGGAKICALSADGVVLFQEYEEYPQFHDHPGYSEHDPKLYWAACQRLMRGAVANVGGNVVAIAVSSALPSLVLVGHDGEPLGRAFNLMDRRASRQVAETIEKVGADRLQELTGNRVEDYPSLVSLMWVAANEPERFAKTAKALTIDGFIAMRLTGRATLNRSCAAFFGVAYDIAACRFDHSVLDMLAIPSDKLPELVDCDELIGTVRDAVASGVGLNPGCLVAGGQVDCNAAWIGGGAVAPGAFQLNLGTAGVIGVVHDRRTFLHSQAGREVVNIPYTTDVHGSYSAVAVTMTGGQALRYLRDLAGPEVLRAAASSRGISAYDLLTQGAEAIPAGSEGLLALPYFMGERVPLWDSRARAAYVGLSLHHRREHLVRAMLEGVAYALRWALDVLREGQLPITEPLILNEGGARSALWRRIITDVLEVRTAVLVRGGGAALGDAILAGVSCGVLTGFDAALQLATPGDHLEPNPAAVAVYREVLPIFKETYEALRSPSSRLIALAQTQTAPLAAGRT
ncbi:FGGY-family carbohydrate kinase [Conexibacter sp. S30A1]|uniref:FGGY-family carbohydrate kinase n=1 Tax=Conexibacter sp. S30A1 TaxID=2937800 RepID=UPI0020108A0C|nr:FGGY family carbohydrate kinase [Conexibacter sp. S30A1]